MNRVLRAGHIMFMPSATVFLTLFLLPVSYFFVISFWRVRSYQMRVDFTFEQYLEVFNEYGSALVYTLSLAVIIAVVTTILAYAFAFFCRFKAGKYGSLLLFVALITLFGGYLTKIYMWKTILGSTGILNSALIYIGLISEPVEAFLFSPLAVVITLTHYTLPLAILPIFGSLRGIEDTPLQAARDLGASPFRVFRDIILPQSKVGVISSLGLTFIFAAGDYVTPLLVGGPNRSMMGVFIQNQFGLRYNPPLGSAMSFSVIFCCLAIIVLFALAIHLITRQKQ